MISTKLASIGLAASLAAILPAISAQAQAPRTFVSAAGSDSNPCSFAAPCRHFQAAVDATSAGGEVDALDPAGYGPITITQAITIVGQGWSYIAPPSGGNGVTINAVSGNVAIHGVSLNGVGITGFTAGIRFNSGGSLTVRDCVIRNFVKQGIDFAPSVGSQLLVSNTVLSDNGLDGITFSPSGSGVTNGILNRVEMEHNGQSGLTVFNNNTHSVNVTVSDSVAANSVQGGIFVSSTGGQVNVMVRNSTVVNNGEAGLEASGAASTIRVTRSTITGNASGWVVINGAVTSYGDNNIDGNTSVNTEPPGPLTYK